MVHVKGGFRGGAPGAAHPHPYFFEIRYSKQYFIRGLKIVIEILSEVYRHWNICTMIIVYSKDMGKTDRQSSPSLPFSPPPHPPSHPNPHPRFSNYPIHLCTTPNFKSWIRRCMWSMSWCLYDEWGFSISVNGTKCDILEILFHSMCVCAQTLRQVKNKQTKNKQQIEYKQIKLDVYLIGYTVQNHDTALPFYVNIFVVAISTFQRIVPRYKCFWYIIQPRASWLWKPNKEARWGQNYHLQADATTDKAFPLLLHESCPFVLIIDLCPGLWAVSYVAWYISHCNSDSWLSEII